jgi:hypothetical protein
MAVFRCEAGELECSPVDMKEIRKRTAEWEKDHPAPVVPLVAHETFEAKMSGRGVDMLPNPEDETYQTQLREWNWKRYQQSEQAMIKQGVKLATPADFRVLALVMIDGKDGGLRQQLYAFIHNISEVTQEAVDDTARRFRLQVARQAVARLAYQKGTRISAAGRNRLQSGRRVVPLTSVGSR